MNALLFSNLLFVGIMLSLFIVATLSSFSEAFHLSFRTPDDHPFLQTIRNCCWLLVVVLAVLAVIVAAHPLRDVWGILLTILMGYYVTWFAWQIVFCIIWVVIKVVKIVAFAIIWLVQGIHRWLFND